MAIRPRQHLRQIPPCPHGSLSYRERMEKGLTGKGVLDFSASCNPLGTSPRVLEAMRDVDLSHYPDDEALELRQALAQAIKADVSWVAVGNGSVDLIYQLASAYLEPTDRALVVGPAFGEYARACRVAGATVVEMRAAEGRGFQPDIEAVRAALRAERPKLVFLCNPNNPTGRQLSESSILEILGECEETLLVVDEAYVPFCDTNVDLREQLISGRLLLLRSMTKDHGLAGLRLGYAVARPDVLDPLGRIRPPWGVNVLAQAAGLAALKDEAHVEDARRVIAEARAYLVGELSALGLGVIPSAANFLLVRVGDGAAFRAAMLARGVCVRDCASFGLPAYVRIGMRTMPDCRRLAVAAREVVARA
ncbi:MAG: histidinol-phosphate aminotransferase family protein [Actinobacteria bacterium]|nr:histidinol-phosphate aminotransferase family protein [Actinomycetota bacterium]